MCWTQANVSVIVIHRSFLRWFPEEWGQCGHVRWCGRQEKETSKTGKKSVELKKSLSLTITWVHVWLGYSHLSPFTVQKSHLFKTLHLSPLPTWKETKQLLALLFISETFRCFYLIFFYIYSTIALCFVKDLFPESPLKSLAWFPCIYFS